MNRIILTLMFIVLFSTTAFSGQYILDTSTNKRTDVVVVIGKVLSIVDDKSLIVTVIQLDNHDLKKSKTVYFTNVDTSKMVDGDKVSLLGVQNGKFQYKAVLGNKRTVSSYYAIWLNDNPRYQLTPY